MNKDLKKILKAAEAAGFETRTTIRNGLADLRRAGFEWPPRR